MVNNFYQDLQPLERERHVNLRFQPSPDASFTESVTAIPLLIEEIPQASAGYPVMFSTSGDVLPVAVLGLLQRNAFLDAQGRWRVSYVPALIRRYPFALARLDQQADRVVLAADMTSPQLGEQGERLFTEAGEPTETLNHIRAFLQRCDIGLREAAQNLKVLADLDVLVERDLTVSQGEQRHVLARYRMVDLERLKALSDADLASLARHGILPTVYAHLESLRHLDALFQASAKPSAAA